jgi:hypothetical protein
MFNRVRMTAALSIVVLVGVATWALLGPLHSTPTSAHAATPFTVSVSSPRVVPVHETANLTGSVAPRSPGATVDLQVKTGRVWHNIASAQLSATSTYVMAFTQANPGFYTIRVVKPASSTRGPGIATATQIFTGTQLKLRPGSFSLTPDQLLSFKAYGNDASTLVLASSAPVVVAGNHLVMEATAVAPNGVLATVTSATRSADGTQLLQCATATLDEVYATFNVAAQNGVVATGSSTQAASAAPGTTLDSAHLDGVAKRGPNLNLTDLGLQCSGPDRPKFSLTADWSAVKVDFELDIYGPDLNFVFVAQPTITMSETFDGSVSCSLPDNEKLQVSFPIVESPPIVLTIKPVLTINATGTVSLGYVFAPYIVLGFDRGDGDDFSQEIMTLHGAPTVSGDASFSSQLGVSIGLSLAGLDGITGTIGPELTGALKGSCVDVGADLAISLEADVNVFVHHWVISLWDGHFFPVQLAHFCFTPPTPGQTATAKGGSSGSGGGGTTGSGGGGSGGSGGSGGTGSGGTTADSSISIAWGSHPAPAGDWMAITFSNFRPGTISWDCVEEGTAYGPYSTTLTQATETLTTNTCFDTAPGGSDQVTADGLRSNTIPSDAQTSTPPPPERSISIGWGSNPAPSGSWMDITFTNFPTGPVSWDCVEEGTAYGPYSTTLSAGTQTLTTSTCYDTQADGSDYVTADGVTSNTIPTDAQTATPPPPPTPSISIGWGGNPAPAGHWMNITFTNFPTGPVSWYCVEEGVSYGPYSSSLSSNTQTFTTSTCYDTQPGGSDYVRSDGVNSNTIGTD